MLKLSNYQMISFIPHPVSIDYRPPYWFKGPCIPELAANLNLVSLWKKGIIAFDEYKFRFYYDVLRKLDPWEILKKISRLSNADIDECALLNYDALNTLSFRHFVGDWIHSSTGIEVKELTIADTKKEIDSEVFWIDPLKTLTNLELNYQYSTINEIPEISKIKEQICIPSEAIKSSAL